MEKEFKLIKGTREIREIKKNNQIIIIKVIKMLMEEDIGIIEVDLMLMMDKIIKNIELK
jgi:hypothetical protein